MEYAERLDYNSTMFMIGARYGDARISLPTVTLYAPQSQVLVTASFQDTPLGRQLDNVGAFVGEKAEQVYWQLRAELPPLAPNVVEVNDEFVDWAKALYKAKNPSRTLVDLLTPINWRS